MTPEEAEEFARQREEFWKDFNDRQHRSSRRIVVHLVGVFTIMSLMIYCNLKNITPHPYSLLWIIVILLWTIFFLCLTRRDR